MIHIIPHHINRGSWPRWYTLIHFTEDVNILQGYDDVNIERNLNQEDNTIFLDDILNNLNVNEDDSVFVDKKYFTNYGDHNEFATNVNKHWEKYKCKFFIIDDDNQYEYSDNEKFTYFSNRFNIVNSKHNFNYFRYRTPTHTWTNNLSELLNPFLYSIRQKKFNFIVGVDKIERLISLKHIYNTQLNLDGYVGYSGFNRAYLDNELSDKLIQFRDTTIPIILDVPFERSLHGAVNVEFPPFPLCLNSYVSCICETMVMDSTEIHLSEKSWNPFISHNIPLILGSKYINEYLRNLGFWLADDLFDLSPKETKIDIVNQFTSNLDIINSMSYDDLYKYYTNNIGAIMRNFDILMKQKFTFNRNNYK
jgi:hypothetical protein